MLVNCPCCYWARCLGRSLMFIAVAGAGRHAWQKKAPFCEVQLPVLDALESKACLLTVVVL